jgi:hypothetical protein
MRNLACGFRSDPVGRARYNRNIHVGLPADKMNDYAVENRQLEQAILLKSQFSRTVVRLFAV